MKGENYLKSAIFMLCAVLVTAVIVIGIRHVSEIRERQVLLQIGELS